MKMRNVLTSKIFKLPNSNIPKFFHWANTIISELTSIVTASQEFSKWVTSFACLLMTPGFSFINTDDLICVNHRVNLLNKYFFDKKYLIIIYF